LYIKCSAWTELLATFLRLPNQLKLLGIVDQAIQDRVGQGQVQDFRKPVGVRNLVYNYGGYLAVTFIQNFQHILCISRGEPISYPTIKNEQTNACQGEQLYRVRNTVKKLGYEIWNPTKKPGELPAFSSNPDHWQLNYFPPLPAK
jgi:hypothetical protein